MKMPAMCEKCDSLWKKHSPRLQNGFEEQKWKWIQKWSKSKKHTYWTSLKIWIFDCCYHSEKWLKVCNVAHVLLNDFGALISTFNIPRKIQNSKKSKNQKTLASLFTLRTNFQLLHFQLVFLFPFFVVLLSSSVFGYVNFVWPRFRWMAHFVK